MTDPHDALHPHEGATPAQPPEPLGAASLSGDATEGHPPFINQRLSVPAWDAYVAAYAFTWKLPSRVVLHHTWRPTLTSWDGLTTMRGMQRHYAAKGWSSAPHVYAAPDGIWLATPMHRIGIHAGRGNGSVGEGWYSIGLEMVGDYDAARPAGPVWANTLAVLRGLTRRIGRPLASVLSFHRDYSTKSCPGHAVTRDWVISQAMEPAPSEPLPIGYTAQSPIMGRAPAPPSALIAAFARVCARHRSPYVTETPNPILETIGPAYAERCAALGVDLAITLAQVGHETGWLTSALSQREDKDGRPLRNPAGIGVWERRELATPTYRPSTVWDADVHNGRGGYRPATQFRDWRRESVPAHVGRLLAYAVPPAARSLDQRLAVEQAMRFRLLDAQCHGSAPRLFLLGSGPNEVPNCGWASPGNDYGEKLASKANLLLREAVS